MEAAGGVDDDDVGAAGLGGADGVVGYAGGVAAHFLLHDGHADALAPDDELLYGGRTEGVGGAEHDAQSGLLELVGELADGGGLAHSVHADYHDDVGLLAFGDFEAFGLLVAAEGEELCDFLL